MWCLALATAAAVFLGKAIEVVRRLRVKSGDRFRGLERPALVEAV